MSEPEYLKCPKCGSNMVLTKKRSNGEEFYGCSKYYETGCRGMLTYEEGKGKAFELHGTNTSYGKCRDCQQYGSLSTMRLCPSCQEDFDDK